MVTKPSSATIHAQRPPVYLQAAAGNSFTAGGGACDRTNWGAAGGISNTLCLQREFTEYFEEESGRSNTMTQQKQTAWLQLCWRGSIYSRANKGFGWKEEDLEWLGIKFFPRVKIKKKVKRTKKRIHPCQRNWVKAYLEGEDEEQKDAGEDWAVRAHEWCAGSPLVQRCERRLRMSNLCVTTMLLRWKPVDAFTEQPQWVCGYPNARLLFC